MNNKQNTDKVDINVDRISEANTADTLSKNLRYGLRLSIKQRLRLKKYSLSSLSLSLVLLSSLFCSSNVKALSANTANTIQGTQPTFNSTHLATIAADSNFSLLSLQATGAAGITNVYTTDTDIANKLLSITNFGHKTLNQLAAILGDDVTSATLSGAYTAITTTDAVDVDGDGNFSLDGTAATVSWHYKDSSGHEQTVSPTKTVCEVVVSGGMPYIKVSGVVKLRTQYGDPLDNTYNAKNIFKIPYPTDPFVCYAQPNLDRGSGIYAGLPSIWNPNYGFLPQDIATPSRNFPTTGSHGLFFYLTLVGATSTDVKNATASSGALIQGGITAVLDDTDANLNKLKVTLTGPNDSLSGAFTPSVFHLKAPVSGGGLIDVYAFELKKWFIVKPNMSPYDSGGLASSHPAHSTSVNEATNYCASLTPANTYRVPSQADYTNQFIGIFIPGTTNYGNYTRAISGALFSEWGYTWSGRLESDGSWTKNGYYKLSDWAYRFYSASEAFNITREYDVRSADGMVHESAPSDTMLGTACVSP